MTDYVLVTNAAAGSTEDDAVEAARAVLARSGSVEVVATSSPDELVDVLRRADGRPVVVAGGDGSLHAVANAARRLPLAERPVLGLVPLGTGNDFARGVGLPLDPAEAAELITGTEAQPVDLLVDDAGEVTVNAVHLGLGAEASRAGARLKPRMGRLGYAAGAAWASLRPATLRVTVRVDGRVVHTGSMLQVALGNSGYVGGGTELVPGADPTDRRVTVIVSGALRPAARLAYAVHLRRGEHHRLREVVRVEGREVEVSGDPFVLVSDGEISGPVTDRRWSVEPGAVRMHLPS